MLIHGFHTPTNVSIRGLSSVKPRLPVSGMVGAVVVVALFPGVAHAQSIGTDRPDFVESSSTVGARNLQVEGAVAFDHSSVPGLDVDNITTPVLLRVGIADSWELRLESDWLISSGVTDTATGGEKLSKIGMSDLDLGVKWAFHASDGAGPSMAALVHAVLPTGSDDFRGKGMRPSLRVTMEWALGRTWDIGVMPGILCDRDDLGSFASGILALAVGKGLTDRFGTFAEVAFEQISEKQRGSSVAFVAFGATLLLNDYWQLDTAVAVGLTDQSPDYGLTLGLSGLFGW